MKYCTACLLAALGLSIVVSGYSLDLLEVYQLAAAHDATFQAAKQTYAAQKEVVPIARGALLPSLELTGNETYNNVSNNSPRSYNSNGYSLALTQQIFNFADWKTYDQAQAQLKQAAVTYMQAKQSLILNTATAYFNVLEAEAKLRYAKKNEQQTKEQMAQAEQKYKVGLAAQTDVLTARASYEAAVATRIADQNQVHDTLESLAVLTGTPVKNLAPLKENFPLLAPQPENPETWVNVALKNNLSLQASMAQAQFDKEAIGIQQAGYFPTVSVTGTYSAANSHDDPTATGHVETKSIAGNLTYDIFSGGQTYFGVKQAKLTHKADVYNIEQTKRETINDMRTEYLTVLSDISQVKALKQAVISGESSMAAARAAYLVGTRTIVDLLQEQSILFNTQQQYATAIYSYITDSLRMKQVVGLLAAKDIVAINKLLVPQSPGTPVKTKAKAS